MMTSFVIGCAHRPVALYKSWIQQFILKVIMIALIIAASNLLLLYCHCIKVLSMHQVMTFQKKSALIHIQQLTESFVMSLILFLEINCKRCTVSLLTIQKIIHTLRTDYI